MVVKAGNVTPCFEIIVMVWFDMLIPFVSSVVMVIVFVFLVIQFCLVVRQCRLVWTLLLSMVASLVRRSVTTLGAI